MKSGQMNGRFVIGASRPNQNKYHAIKTQVEGITFASRREAERYTALRYLEKCGEISDLQTQVRFDLIPPVTICGRTYRATYYLADFTYYENDEYVVEDCKGFRTKEYSIKRKLMKHVHNLEVKES